MLEKLIRAKAEVAVLNVVLFTDGLHLREIARRARVSPYEAKRELDNLVELGILMAEKRGNQSIFHADGKCSFLVDLRNLFAKTEGAIAKIKQRLGRERDIKYSFIYGSAAAGRLSEKSDIDLMIIGEISEERLDAVILALQKRTKREINYILWTERDFHKKLKGRSAFLKNIAGKKIDWISGEQNEFIRVVEKANG